MAFKIQEDIDLSDIYSAVSRNMRLWILDTNLWSKG